MGFQDGDGWVGGSGGGKQLPKPPGLTLHVLRSGALVNLTADGRTLSSTSKHVSEFLSSLPDAGASSAAAWGGSGARGNEALTVPTQVRSLWPGVGPGVGHAARGKGARDSHCVVLNMLLQRLAVRPSALKLWTRHLPNTPVLLSTPSHTQVNYVGKGGNLYTDAGYKLHGSAYVIEKYLGNTWLWDRVRVVGGAYGGFCSFDPQSGSFNYLSYRCVGWRCGKVWGGSGQGWACWG